jgi:hypothetical protein
MRARGYTRFVAVPEPGEASRESVMGGALNSGYIKRGDAVMPRQGTRGPWRVVDNYFRDRALLRKAPLEDGILTFSREAARPEAPPAGDREDAALGG